MDDYKEQLIHIESKIEEAEKLNDFQGLALLYNNQGNFYYKLGDFKTSIDIIKKSSTLAIKEKIPELFASNLYIVGLCYEKLEDYKNAKGAFNLALFAAKKINNRELGRKTFRKLIELKRETVLPSQEKEIILKTKLSKGFGIMGLLLKGSEEFGKRNYREAIKILNQFNKKNPNHFGSWLLLIECHLKLNNPQEIIRCSEQALKAKQKGFFWGTLGDGYYLKNDFKKASKYFKKAIKVSDKELLKNPLDDTTFNTIGWYHIKLGNFKEAIKYSEEALKIKPNSEHHLHNIGLAYLKMENYQEAIKYFEKALKIDKTHSYSLYDLGCTYEKLNNKEKAYECFENAVKYDPQWQKLRDKLIKLNPESPYLSLEKPDIPNKNEEFIKKKEQKRKELEREKTPESLLKGLKETSEKLLKMDEEYDFLKLMNLEKFVDRTGRWAKEFLDFLQNNNKME